MSHDSFARRSTEVDEETREIMELPAGLTGHVFCSKCQNRPQNTDACEMCLGRAGRRQLALLALHFRRTVRVYETASVWAKRVEVAEGTGDGDFPLDVLSMMQQIDAMAQKMADFTGLPLSEITEEEEPEIVRRLSVLNC